MSTLCACSGCSNPVPQNPKAKRPRVFCSNGCRQKSYRLRNRNTQNVTLSSYSQIVAALDSLTQNQLTSIRERIDVRLQSPEDRASLLYYRKGDGVVHLAVDRNVTFCRRETENMAALHSDDGQKICQRCATVRDTKTWWHGWHEAFGNGGRDIA